MIETSGGSRGEGVGGGRGVCRVKGVLTSSSPKLNRLNIDENNQNIGI